MSDSGNNFLNFAFCHRNNVPGKDIYVMSEGMIFSIHRFALHDGPGIRTTVFLKSCPLNCAWCHNPESISGKPEIAFFEERCTLCGSCVAVCPWEAHKIEGGLHSFNHALCDACGKCVEVCPSGALQKTGFVISAENLVREVIKDRAYFDESGGGLTLSGGEPMAQPDFTLEVLRLARANGIRTCLDTCGLAPTATFEKTLPFVDLYLFDYKHSDPLLHKKYTGSDNTLILKNLDFLLGSGARVHLRCPIIPGVNDNEAHIHSVIALEKQYPQLEKVTLLPYHNTARSKNHRYGYNGRLVENVAPDKKLIEKWQDQVDTASAERRQDEDRN